MYLHTPKRYTRKGSRPRLISLRWLWLYLLAPVVIIAGALAWDFRDSLSQQINNAIGRIHIQINAPTLTPTLPAADLQARIQNALQSGDLKAALDEIRAYDDSNPNDVKWHAVLTQLLTLRAYGNNAQTAIDSGQTAINANPEVADGWAAEALALDWGQQSQVALSADWKHQLQAALSDALYAKDLGDPTGMADATLAGIYLSLNKVQDAGTFANNALKANPNLAYAYFVKGQLAAISGDIKGAISLYRQAWDASKLDPTQPSSYIAVTLAKTYSTQNQIDSAKTILTDAETRDKSSPQLRYTLANLLYGQGDYNKATEAAQQCLDVAQDYAPCYVLLTRLYTISKQDDKVLQMAQAAAKLGTTETAAYYNGGQAAYHLNQCADAIPLFQAGLKISQNEQDSGKISDFVAALNECGVTGGLPTTATPTPSPSTPVRTPTVKK
ncbi:MAG: tetratricopeptide repeat protein [Aggregatilineales bacterium]